MMRRQGKLSLLKSVRAKLLIVLAVLSLPLLVVSLIQLNNYRTDLNEQAAANGRSKCIPSASSTTRALEVPSPRTNRPG